MLDLRCRGLIDFRTFDVEEEMFVGDEEEGEVGEKREGRIVKIDLTSNDLRSMDGFPYTRLANHVRIVHTHTSTETTLIYLRL
jgi:hypothetical protein